MWRKSCCGIALLFVSAGSAISAANADETPAASSPATQPVADQARVTRADLAAAYLRLEQAYFANPPEGEKVSTINRGFDQATMAFFMGRNAEAIRAIDELTESIERDERVTAQRAISSLKVTPMPAVWRLDENDVRALRVQSIYDWQSDSLEDVACEVRVNRADGRCLVAIPLVVSLGPKSLADTRLTFPETSATLEPGRYQIELGLAGKPGIIAGHVNVVSSSLDALRETNAEQLAKITADSSAIEKALASCRARNQLLTDTPSVVNSAQFMADMHQLSKDVTAEIAVLAAGENPYSNRSGDSWRVFVSGKREVPLRVYAPQAAQADKPLPLLVVLHGMGGDENMFFEAYGAGIIKQIAEKSDALVVSPLTYTFGSDIRTLQALVDDLANDYQVDRDRVYVLGHSMGAGATASLARGHAETIAAACCIAGGSLSPASGTPPVLVVIPELDGVVPPARVRTSAERAASAGMAVEVREMPGFGHTLAVGIALPDAVDWLLKHKRTP